MSVSVTCAGQGIDELEFDVSQTNELVIGASYTRTGQPIPDDSVVEAQIEDAGTVIANSAITLLVESPGVFAGVFPILVLESGRMYDLRLKITIASVLKVDKTFPITAI